MNERIKEIHNQTMYWVADNGGLRISDRIPTGYTEKLVELIVRECAEQIKTQGISASSEGYGDYEIGFNAGLFHALHTTKEHFGVEE